MRSVPRLHKESIVRCEWVSHVEAGSNTYWQTDPQSQCDFDFVSEFGSWKPVGTARELQLKGVSQRVQEPLDTEAEDATPLEAATKEHNEDRDWEH
jgi:hypothetical protein